MEKPQTLAGPGPSDTGSTQTDFLAGFLTEAEYVRRRGISRRTAQRARQLRLAPPYILIGRQVYYRVESLREWLVARECRQDREPVAPRARKGG